MQEIINDIYKQLKAIVIFDPDFKVVILEKVATLLPEKIKVVQDLLNQTLSLQKDILNKQVQKDQITSSEQDDQKIKEIKNLIDSL